MGVECKLMEDSGLDGLWDTVYTKNSLPKIMGGNYIYTKTLRACLLNDVAQHMSILRAIKYPRGYIIN